ncbi:hypothetical protein C5S29_12385 [ANME-1 cluster archaeon GoMg3.2]|nr:hypothetical protein [ANME-1 cluster archaeon GoMg3.2]
MTGKKIAVLVLVLVGLVLALAIGIISAPDVSEGPVMKPAVKNASVSPPEGNYTDSFTYTVDVRFYEESLIELQLYDPTKKDWITYKTREYRDTLGWETLRWDWIPSDRAWEGQNVTYRFRWNSTDLVYGKGPYIKEEIAWEFRNAIVRPSSGYYNDKFSYSVSVKLNKEEELSLEVFNISSYKWEVRGEKQYNDTGNWQLMKWDNITDIASADSEGLASYRFFFIESGERHESEIYYGPTLKPTIPEEIFKNATVDPYSGHYNTLFSYGVEVSTNEDVLLTVYDISIDEWVEKGKGTKKGNRWEWENIQFNKDCAGLASYKFVAGTHESEIYYGPTLKIIVPEEIFKNATVNPDSGYYNTPFSYGVEVNTSEDVVLMVYDISIDEWKDKGKGTKTGNKWEWENIQFKKDGAGFASYKFVAGTHVSRIYDGPTLMKIPTAEEIFKNATVYPSKGDFSTAFNYTVEVNNTYSGIEISNVTLEVYNGSWRHKGPGTSRPGGNRWEWKDITFGEGYEGVAKYKFLCNNKYKSAVYDGPLLLTETPTIIISGGGGGGGGSYKPYIRYENAIVDPSWEVIGVREEKSFNYSVDVDRDVSLVLAIYNASSKEWEEKGGIGEESRHKDRWRHEWRVNLTLDKNWEGTSKYRFYPDKQERYASQIFYGPEIKTTEASLAGWKKEIGVAEKALKEPELSSATVTPTKDYWFKKFTYTAEIEHPDRANMTVVLFVYKPGSKEWKPVPWRGYRYNPIIHSSDYDESSSATVSWTVEKKEVFDEGDAGQRSAFHFWYWDGYNEYKESKGSKIDGPTLLANEAPEFVKAVTPNPEYGSTHTVYTYTFEVNDPDNDTVYGWLTITDPLNEEHVIEGTGKEGVIKFRVGPGLGIFTEDKLREYINKTNEALFTSQYRLEYWDDGMAVNGEEAKTTAWFEGPHVSLIRIEPKMEPPDPVSGKYADEFEYHVGFYSSKDNTFWLDLSIHDPSNPEHAHQTLRTKRLSVSADTTNYTSWKVKPEVFGPGDFGKNASYAIAWEDEVGNKGVLEGSGPYIERAVPLLSWDLPLVPIISMVIVPLIVIGISLLSVLSGVPVSSLLRRRLGKLRKEREKGEED